MDLVNELADYVLNLDLNLSAGTIRLLAGLFFGYPYAIVHRFILPNNPVVKNLVGAVVGLALLFWAFGQDAYHIVGACVATYIVMFACPVTSVAVAIVFIGSMSQLLYLYYETYNLNLDRPIDVDITAPHCIMVLKLVSFAYDVHDAKVFKKKNLERPITPGPILDFFPNPLQFFGFCWFPVGLFAGPFFRYIHYHKFNDLTLFENNKCVIPPTFKPMARCLMWSAVHALAFHFGGEIFPDKAIWQPGFTEQPVWWQMVYAIIALRIRLFKYVLSWFLVEGSGVLVGIAYSGYNSKTKEHEWTTFSNIKPVKLMFAYNFAIIVEVWHVTANTFLRHYVYKRLMFLGIRPLSLVIAMVWLALWHGLYAGFYVCFITEFVMLLCERSINNRIAMHFGEKPPAPLVWLGLLIFLGITAIGWTFALIPFVVLSWERTHMLWSAWYYCVFIFCPAVVALDALAPRPRRKSVDAKKDKSS